MTSSSLLFLCPSCGAGNPFPSADGRCASCRHVVTPLPGIHDLLPESCSSRERAFYQDEYRNPLDVSGLDADSLEALWAKPTEPEAQAVLWRLGPIRGKRVLLLGNGTSRRELALLARGPELLVYSDLSLNAVVRTREMVEAAGLRGNIAFAALDATHLPFAPESFDVVYAYAMVHHLPQNGPFLQGVFRILRPGGRAVFMDDAYSPLWQTAKRTLLWPLMRLSHRRTGISPEDYRATMRGGLREEDLERDIVSAGGIPAFERLSFFSYLAYRAGEKLLPPALNRAIRKPAIAASLNRLDAHLKRSERPRRQLIRLVWGFEKPGSAVGPGLPGDTARPYSR